MIGLPTPHGPDWRMWAERLNSYLGRTWDRLTVRRGDETAADDGLIMWDREISHPVISKSGVWTPLAYGHNACGAFYSTATQTIATANTAQAVTWNGTALSHMVAIDGTHTSRLNFSTAGTYQIDFSGEIMSSSSSAKHFYFWPRINGTDLPNSTMTTTLESNNERIIASRSGIFEVNAGDYLEAMMACDSTSAGIYPMSATAFAPAAPSATINIVQIDT